MDSQEMNIQGLGCDEINSGVAVACLLDLPQPVVAPPAGPERRSRPRPRAVDQHLTMRRTDPAPGEGGEEQGEQNRSFEKN